MTKPLQQQNDSHGTLRVPWLTIALSFMVVILFLVPPQIFNTLIFNKNALYRGELWRFITGHFVHCNFDHLLWDVLAFVILGVVIETHNRRHLIFSLAMSCLGVSAFLMMQTSSMSYCGLSGALNGLLVVAALTLWRETRNRVYLMVILATMAKIVFELTTHQTIFTALSLQAVPSAHAMGLVMGFGYMFWTRWKKHLILSHQ